MSAGIAKAQRPEPGIRGKSPFTKEAPLIRRSASDLTPLFSVLRPGWGGDLKTSQTGIRGPPQDRGSGPEMPM